MLSITQQKKLHQIKYNRKSFRMALSDYIWYRCDTIYDLARLTNFLAIRIREAEPISNDSV